MIDVIKVMNCLFRVRGNLLKINFMVDDRRFEAFVPDDALFVAVKDVLLNREYEYIPEFELLFFRGKRVVDAGAHVGLYSLVASTFAREVISIEPHPLNFRFLEINRMINEAENIIPLNRALWSKRTTLKLYEGAHTGEHSVLQDSLVRYHSVQSITLEDLINEFGRIDLLKMDVEGSEFEIFRRINSDIMEKINHLCMEIHLRKGESDQIINFLTLNGFKIKSFYPPIVKKCAMYQIKLENFKSLKIMRKLIYGVSNLLGKKDESLMLLFAMKNGK